MPHRQEHTESKQHKASALLETQCQSATVMKMVFKILHKMERPHLNTGGTAPDYFPQKAKMAVGLPWVGAAAAPNQDSPLPPTSGGNRPVIFSDDAHPDQAIA